MRVLIVGPDRQDPGGVANYYNAVFPRISDSEVTAHYLEIGSTRGGGKGLHVVLDQLRFWRAIGQIKPDLIHLNPSLDIKSFLRDGAFIFLAKLRGKPVLVFFRGWQQPFESIVSSRLKWFFKLTYARANGFVVLANAFASCLKQWGITVPIYLANTAVADEMLCEFNINSKLEDLAHVPVIRLLYLARLERQKGVLELLSAMEILLQRNLPVTLTIAGDGPIMNEVKQAVANLGLYSEKVNIIGYVRGQAKVDTLTAHHIYCFPTQYGEGMPNSVLEAMAFGQAVVTCPVGGIADFFDGAHMGALIDTSAPQIMAEEIAALVSNRQGLLNAAKYNFEFAQRHFLASSAANFLRLCYKNLI